MESRGERIWNVVVQVCLPLFTIGGFLLTSLKLPQYGVIAGLLAQIFWLYASYKALRTAKQVGIFINTICSTVIFAYGVLNYWYF
jgi:hypothetical protein